MKEILFTSSVLILALLVLRAVFRHAISRRVQYALWALVLARLLIPVSLPASFSLTGQAQGALNAAQDAAARPVYSESVGSAPVADYPEAFAVEPGESFTPRVIEEREASAANYAERSADGGEVQLYKAVSFAEVLRFGWYIGMAGMTAWFIIYNLRFALRLRASRRLLSGKNRVYVSDAITSPCLFGLFRPAIYVTPEAAQDKTMLRHVLIHEKTHKAHLDPIWSFLRAVCLIVYFFDPLVWLAAYVSRIDGELACDEGALAALGEDERLAYGETLLALVPVRRASSPILASTSMSAGKKQLRDRISRIAEHKKPLVIALAAVLMLAAVIGALCFTGGRKTGTAEDTAFAQTGKEAQNPGGLPIPETISQRNDASPDPFTPHDLESFGLTLAQFKESENLSDADLVETNEKSFFTHRLAEKTTIEGYDFTVYLRFDASFDDVLDGYCLYLDPRELKPEEKYGLLMKLYKTLCDTYGESHADSNTPWIAELAGFEEFEKNEHLSTSAWWELPGDWNLPNAVDTTCSVGLHYATDSPILQISYVLDGHWVSPFEMKYSLTLPRELPDSGMNELDRVLTALAQEYDEAGLPMEYDAINGFLAEKPEFLALGESRGDYEDAVREIVEMLRGGFDLGSTREHFLVRWLNWLNAKKQDPNADFARSCASFASEADVMPYMLFERLFWTEPETMSDADAEMQQTLAASERGSASLQSVRYFLSKLYPGFPPDDAVGTMQTKNADGEDVQLNFWTRTLGNNLAKSVYLYLSDGMQHYVWIYSLEENRASLREAYITYEEALERIYQTPKQIPQAEPADPLLLDLLLESEQGVFDALALTEDDYSSDRDTPEQKICILTEKTAKVCGYDFRILLDFDSVQDPNTDRRILTRFDYFLPVDDLTKEELYTLCQDLCTILSVSYGEPRTAIDGTFAQIEGLADFDPAAWYTDRWLVPGNWAIDGAQYEKVLCADLLLCDASTSLQFPDRHRVLWLRFMLRDNLSMQPGFDHLYHIWL